VTDRPMRVDISDNLAGKFGLVEFEKAAVAVLRYLADDTQQPDIPEWLGERGEGWAKKFTIGSVAGISPVLFACMCSAGWFDHMWFPKGWFAVSSAFRDRVTGVKNAN
jgi:hypothetical protein